MNSEQHELYEYARKRIKQKKLLYYHFVLLFLGSILLFVSNRFLNIYPQTNWWIWAVTFWVFLFVLHFIKVFITDSFMNNKLIIRQEKKIEQLKADIEAEKIKP